MKLYFLKDQSLYTIFRTLEKVPTGKTVHIFIDPEHSLFEHERWGKQIKDLLEKKKIHAIFMTKTEKCRRYFTLLQCEVQHEEKHKLLKILNLIFLLIFNIKKFHLYVYTKRNHIFYVVFGFEVLFVMIVFYALYILILPSVNIIVRPSYQTDFVTYNFRFYPASNTQYPKESRQLSIPFYTGAIDYKYTMSIAPSQIEYIQNPSQGVVQVINTSPMPYSLIANTKFITDDGRLFVSIEPIKIPPAVNGVAGETYVKVKAMEKDVEGVLMGVRGNLEKGTRMYIRNLKRSYYLKELYAVVTENFSGGSLQGSGVVTAANIMTLSGKLIEYIQQQKQNILFQNVHIDNGFVLRFGQAIQPRILNVQIYAVSGQQAILISGMVIARIEYLYTKRDDFLSVVRTHVQQRPSDKVKLLDVDKNSLVFFDEVKFSEDTIVVPTQINLVQKYDFSKDINGILNDIKNRVVGISKKQARDIIISYPEVSSVTINVRPPRYSYLPKLKSRINISVDDE